MTLVFTGFTTDKSMAKPLAPKNSNCKMLVNRQATVTRPKSPSRDNTFSQSRDIREDRGSRQMKTNHNTQSFTRLAMTKNFKP